MASFNATQNGRYDVESQLIDGILTVPYKWFSLHNNKLDGTFHPIDSSGNSQIGWWGTVLSGSDGSFSSAPTITITLTVERAISSVIVVGDDKLNEYPVDFSYSLYDTANNLLLVRNIVGNTQVQYIDYLAAAYTANRLVITITKINKANAVLKMSEFYDYGTIKRSDTILTLLDDANSGITSTKVSTDTINPKTSEVVAVLGSQLTTTDSLLTKINEALSYWEFRFTSVDSLLITDAEVATSNVSEISTDTLSTKVDDIQLYKIFGSIDTISLNTTEVVTQILLPINTVDTMLPKVTEVHNENVSFTDIDSVLIKTTESVVNFNSTDVATDTLLLQTSETSVSITIPTSDTLLVTATETVTYTQNTDYTTDSVLIRTDDTGVVSSNKVSLDSLLVKTSESIISTYSSDINYDSLLLTDTEISNGNVSLNSTDNITVVLNETDNATVSASSADNILVASNLIETNALQSAQVVIDIVNTKISEVIVSMSNTDIATDSILVKALESISILTNTFSSSDTLNVKVLENVTSNINSASSDNITVLVQESAITNVTFNVNDLLTVTQTELIITQSTITSTDIVSVVTSETDLLNVQAPAIDTLLSTTVEVVNSITRPLTVQDDLKVLLQESRNANVSFSRLDSVLIKFNELIQTTASFNRIDNIALVITENTNYIAAKFYTNDIINITVSEVYREVHASVSTTESLKLNVQEAYDMTNVHTRMDEYSRQIFGKVEILYSDPLMETTLDYTVSSLNRVSDILYVSDSLNNLYKGFMLHDNKLDSSYHPIAPTEDSSPGWIGNVLSDSNGVFATPQTITTTFIARPIIMLTVLGDAPSNCYPVDFTIDLYTNDTIIYTETVVGNTVAHWSKQITQVDGITKMVLSITKISMQAVAKVNEFFSIIKKTYTAEEIVSIHVLEELDYIDDGIPLGAISSNEIDIVLDNSQRQFNLHNPNSAMYNLLKKNRKVTAWLGVEVLEGEIEWHKLGVFWTTRWSVPRKSLEATLVARDTIELMRQDEFTTSQLYVNQNLYNLYEMLFIAFGLDNSEYVIDSSLTSIVIPYVWFDRISYKAALSELSKCALVKVFCDRDGRVVVKKFSVVENYKYIFDEDKNLYDSDFPMVGTDVTNCVEVRVNTLSAQASEKIYDMTTPLVVSPLTTETITCIYNSIPNINVQDPVITKDVGLSIVATRSYVWGVEIDISNSTGVNKNVSAITVSGQPLKAVGNTTVIAQDDVAILQDGKIKSTVNCPFIQSVDYAKVLSNEILTTYNNQRKDVKLDSRGNIAIAIGDVVKVNSEYTTEDMFTVFRQDIEWDGTLNAIVEGKKI